MSYEGIPQKTEEEIFSELADIRSRRYEQYGESTHAKIVAFARHLAQRFSREEVLNARLYHMLIGSTAYDTTILDVNGGEIEKFIREEL